MKMFNPPHPGEVIADFLEEPDLGIRDLARALDIAPSTAQHLVSCKQPELRVKRLSFFTCILSVKCLS
ncbi:hypothetical protein PTE_02915 [Photorhabdus khanii NC19]|uniref:Addiction module antidote protein, HigA family n=1 Tax=Photorhabdus khanii NC19 TaxID=1004151 RepID=W3V544_9GAMM|nr:hypothetical protein PTE_02915 [Photorhabdus khanii NC19]